MPRIIIPSSIRNHTENRREVRVGGACFKDSIAELLTRYPGLEAVVNNGALLSFFINSKLLKADTEDWEAIAVNEDDEISLIVPIAGG